MGKTNWGILTLGMLFISFLLLVDVAWALKNVCPRCGLVIANLELTTCIRCGKIVNKCMQCGTVNPIKNDHCSKCNASLAESRIQRTIATETRADLQLGESPRAKIDVELEQIRHKAEKDGLTAEQGARQVELLTAMGWWSQVNTAANDFTTRFPEAEETPDVAANRVIALRHLGFLAIEDGDLETAREFLQTGLALDPNDRRTKNLLKKIADKN
ncbi:MAG: hypothetical protein GX442_13940 [Candidatus Riflebacteria bacterium]|nr:hypothetical protein [Candidatus Riflebacteria bacterium]